MGFIETRGNDGKRAKEVSFSEAILNPSSSFGGLYVPKNLPNLGDNFIENHINKSYKELAFDILKAFEIDIDDTTRYGVRITEAGSFFAKILAEFEYFS